AFMTAWLYSAPHTHYVWQRAEASQHAAELFEPVYADAQRDIGRPFARVGYCRHVLNADLLIGENAAHIAHQAATVERIEGDVDPEELVALLSPGYLNDTLRLTCLEPQQAGAGVAVNTDPTAQRDVTRDRFRRNRSAAARHLRQKIANLLDDDATRPGRGGSTTRNHARLNGLGVRTPLNRSGDLGAVEVAGADRNVQRVGIAQPELVDQFGQRKVASTEALELALQNLPSFGTVLRLVALAKEAAHLGAAAWGGEEAVVRVEPVAAGLCLLRRDNLDDLPVLQLVIEGHHAAIHLRAATAMAEIGMHVIGEVEWSRLLGQIDHLALGCEHVHPVFEDFRADTIQEVTIRVRAVLGFEEPAHPADLGLIRRIALAALLIFPVRSDTELRVFVHLTCPDLHFERLVPRPEHRGVERTVEVVLWGRNVIVEGTGDIGPQAMDYAKGTVAIGDGVNQHPQRAHIQ